MTSRRRQGAKRLGLAVLLVLLPALTFTACSSSSDEDQLTSPPATPNGLRASPGNAQVILTWQANAENDLSDYGVYQGTSSGTLSKVAEVPAGTTTYTVTGLTNGTVYFFALDAVNKAGQRSARSTEISATPTAEDPSPTAPAVPSGLGVIPGDGRVTLHWNANGEADLAGYGVYQGVESGALTKLADIPAGTVSYTATGLTNGITYFFALDAVNSAKQRSLPTAEVSVVPTADPLPHCTLGTATLGSCTLGS